MRAFSYRTRSYSRSRNKDGGQAIWSAVEEKCMLHANFAAVCFTEAELLAIEFSHCGDRIESLSNAVLTFCSCNLDLDPMTFI